MAQGTISPISVNTTGAEYPAKVQAFEAGLHDLGEMRLGEPQVFVEGRVVDTAGQGVADAPLRLERQRNVGDQTRWSEVWDFRFRTDAE